ncbi:MAG: ABC transporter ATP-binding protein [Acidobacteria bacterium]|nr:ABC transporter ATP-binding protein [Acidobacteriota bacterium]
MSIHVNHLTRRFGEHVAVNDVSFEIKPGETFALLGPNGSGKTTTLKCIVGLLEPTAGQIQINQLDVWKDPHQARRLFSYLPQRVAFPDGLTAREVLQFYADLRQLAPQRVDTILSGERFHFNGFTDKPVGKFSGGMVQRLGLAVACLPDAPVLLLDEPTVSLDPEGALRFRAFLQALKAEGKTIVFTSHVLADVEQLADRVAILVGGKLVAIESITALREGLMRSSRMRVVLRAPQPSLQTAALTAGASEVLVEGESLLIVSRPEDRLEILRALENNGGHVERFATEELSLEDIYLRYIEESATHV